jgi:transcriptional regulator with XRE-family HTH domain
VATSFVIEAKQLPDDPGNDIDSQVRRRLKLLRLQRDLTLSDVAGRAHIDVSTLSRLESGKRRLALDHIPRLAQALGVSTDELLGSGVADEDPVVHGEVRHHGGLTLWPLTRRGPAPGVQAFRIVISAKRRTPPRELPIHEGHDWFYVLAGRMRLVLGDRDLIAKPGQAVEFSTLTPHWFGCVDESVEAIAMFGSQGERTHLHRSV